ncbi:RAB6A-GEF complex partner protein 2-like [Amphiura filiformis]|uniref:RAB6A-GEF complex partner protein 2-like n=1 Tax=Amphiura filiformis TaxID=82378 RepID=UPI003B21BD79
MIEVTANLCRGTVFLAGEVLECSVTISCREGNGQGSRGGKSLAWASAQLHCQCHVSESKVKVPTERKTEDVDLTQSTGYTSFVPSRGEKGVCILSTTPKILCCDVHLRPGDSKTFLYRETIPSDAPPSFRGQAVKYSYKVTIGTQRVNSPIKLLRVPFRVLVLYGLGDTSFMEDEDQVDTSNPFLEGQKTRNTLLDTAVQILATVTSRKSPNSYNVSNPNGTVARFCLFKPAYKLGEDIIGTIDFSISTIPCLQYSVVLQCDEHIADECQGQQYNGITSISKHQEFCLHMTKSHVVLPIPLHATPGFITDIVCLKWRLHFEFITAKEPLPDQVTPADQSESALWQGPENIAVDTLVWNLPIKILPMNPIQATSAATVRTPMSITI